MKIIRKIIRGKNKLQYIIEYDKYIEITGYKKIAFDKAEALLKIKRKQPNGNINIQFFDAELIATQEHLYFAILNALQAFENKINLSKSLAMETMLYASAQRQIQKAIGYCGLKQKTKRMALIIIGQDPKQIENELLAITKSLRSKPDHSVLEITARKESKIKRVFRISEEELKIMENGNHEKAVANLVIERVALLATIV